MRIQKGQAKIPSRDLQILRVEREQEKRSLNHSLRRVSKASKKSGAMSMFGVLTAHFSPGLPITVVSSIKKGIPLGILVEK